MDTSKHGGKDSDKARADASDNDPQTPALTDASSKLVRTSRLAVAACVLAVVSLLLLPGLLRVSVVRGRVASTFVRDLYQYIAYSVSISAAILGLVSLGRIGLSAGRLAGRGFAWTGVTAPVVQYLLFLLLIALARPRSVAFRMTCGTNLSGIGKAMLIYGNDYEDEFPRAGGPGSRWTGRIPDWQAADRYGAYGLDPRDRGSGGQVSMTASLYLLVKYAEVTPRSFVCGGTRKTREEGVTEFRPRTYRVRRKGMELVDFWDFGPNPTRHVSYTYHMVYGSHKLSTLCEPGMVVAADRNPWMNSPSAKAKDFSLFSPDIAPFGGSVEQGRYGNTFRHHQDGQNVLFLDSHVEFAKRPYCALDNDNIYTSWDGDDKVRGKPPKVGSMPAGPTDSLLVNDPIRP